MIVVDALAYRRRETTQKTLSARGIQISLACGVLNGSLLSPSCEGNHGRTFTRSLFRGFLLCAGYGLASNKGYATPDHMQALARSGPTPLHRLSFEPVRAAALFPVDADPWADMQLDLFQEEATEAAACQ